MVLPERIRQYLQCGLEATPEVLGRLLGPQTDPASYDWRPDSERFTVREVLAHLADWEGVFGDRLRMTLTEEAARFPDIDPAQMAIDHHYAHTDPAESLALFRQRRSETLALLRGLDAMQWERTGTHTQIGLLTVETQVVMIGAHDGYHTQQILEWLPR